MRLNAATLREAIVEEIREGRFNQVYPSLSETQLMDRDPDGNTLLHVLAIHSQMRQIPERDWTMQRLMATNKAGETVAHHAVVNGFFEQVPPALLGQTWLWKDKAGIRPLHRAAEWGSLGIVPCEHLTREKLALKTNEGWNFLHYAVYNGHVSQVPRDLVTWDNLLAKDKYGRSCFHLAAIQNQWNTIPAEFLTERCLAPDTEGWTPIHHACTIEGGLRSFTPALLTPERMMAKINGTASCAVDLAIQHGCENEIPIETLASCWDILEVDGRPIGALLKPELRGRVEDFITLGKVQQVAADYEDLS